MKRIFSVLFTSIFFTLLCVTGALAGYYDEGHSGLTENDAFIIDSREDLVNFRDRINSGRDPKGAYYKLDVRSKTISLVKGYEDWEPIGKEFYPFTGHLEGNGHNIKMNSKSLFGVIKTESGYAIRNLTVSGNINDSWRAGGIALDLYNASIENCTFSGALTVATSDNSDSGAHLTSSGGIVDILHSGTIKNCIVTGATIKNNPFSLWGEDAYVGGIAAKMEDGTIENCTVSADSILTGGENRAYTTGSAAIIRAGGIVGIMLNGDVVNNEVYSDISFAYYRELFVGGIIGYIDDENFLIENNKFSKLPYGIGSDIDGEATNEPGCIKISFGTEEDPIIIDSISAFEKFRTDVNTNFRTSGNVYYQLTTDLDTRGIKDWEPIGTDENPFLGHFDGQGHTIIIETGGALFGTIKTENSYAVKNLNVVGNFYSRYAAGIALNLYNALIENCTFSGRVRAVGNNSIYSTNEESSYAAGIVEHLFSGSIKDCTVENAVINSEPHYFAQTGVAGGIIARMDGGTVENCTVTSNSIIQCISQISTYKSTAEEVISGGLVGVLNAGTLKNNNMNAAVHALASPENSKIGCIIGKIEGALSKITLVNNRFILNGEVDDSRLFFTTTLPRYAVGYNAAGSGIVNSDISGCINIGKGLTEDNPFIIDTGGALLNLQKKVNSGTNIENLYYRLTADFSIGAWDSIGTNSYPFTGHLDGNNHTLEISGQAMFGAIKTNGYALKNLNIKGNFVSLGNACSVVKNLIDGEIDNCSFSGKVVAFATFGYVEETPQEEKNTFAGGLALYMSSGSIKNCKIKNSYIISNPFFVGASGYAGGIVTEMSGGSIENCSIDENTIIAGVSQFQTQAPYGVVLATNTATIITGGIVGVFKGGNVKNNEAYSEVHGWSCLTCLGAVIGSIPNEAASTFTIENNKYSSIAEVIDMDSDNERNLCNYLPIQDVINGIKTSAHVGKLAPNSFGSAYPYTSVASLGIGENKKAEGNATDNPGCINLRGGYKVTEEDPILISSMSDLENIHIRLKFGKEINSTYYRLTNDIIITDTEWEPLGEADTPFMGHFDGNGHIIEMHVDKFGDSRAGLFGTIKTEAGKYAVKNLTVKGELKGRFVGGIALELYNGSIENCIFSGTLTSKSSKSYSEESYAYAGGIVEHLYSGTIKNCLVDNSSITVTSSYSYGIGYAGGITARMDGGTVEGCSVTDNNVILCIPDDISYYTSTVVNVGGIVGILVDRKVKDNESRAAVHGIANTSNVGAIVGSLEPDLTSNPSLENNSYVLTVKSVIKHNNETYHTKLAIFGVGNNESETSGCVNLNGNGQSAKLPQFTTHALVLSGQIGVIFYVELPEIAGVTYTPENCWMEFDVNGDTTTNEPQYFDPTIYDAQYNDYHFVCYVSSVQMADPITATLHYGNGQTVTHEYSIDEYFNTILGKPSTSQEMRDLANAMKDYGHYMQNYLARRNNWEIGTKHLAMDYANLCTEKDINEVKELVKNYAIVRDTGNSGIAKVEFALELDSETIIDVYLIPKQDYTGPVTAYLDGKSENVAKKQSNGEYLVQITGVSAHLIANMYNIAVEAGEKFDVKVSALSYAHMALNKENAALDMKEAVTALYDYYDATMAYRRSKGQ